MNYSNSMLLKVENFEAVSTITLYMDDNFVVDKFFFTNLEDFERAKDDIMKEYPQITMQQIINAMVLADV